jgi:thiol-disulfide isomerase/thioredoxin
LDTPTVTLFFALLATVAQLAVVVALVLGIGARWSSSLARAKDAVLAEVRPQALALATAVALVATVGSLYLSEVAGFPPCRLCWFQRIAMYPLVVVLGGDRRRDLGLAPVRRAVPHARIGIVRSHQPVLDQVGRGVGVPDHPRHGPLGLRPHPRAARRGTTRLRGVPMNATPAPGSAGSGNKLWIGAVALVLVAGIAAVLLARGGSDGDAEATGQTGTVASTETTSLPLYDATLATDPAVGMTIPSVTGTGFDGEEMELGPDGTAKVILFVAHWCPHCQREVPLLVEHLAEQPMPDDVELLTVSTGVEVGAENYPPEEWLASEDWTAPVIADDEDGTIASTFGLSAFPYFVVVDAEGTVVARATGELTTEQFDDAVALAQG